MRLAILTSLAFLTACGGGGGGGTPAPTTYAVTAAAQSGGTIAPASASVASGGGATFTVTPASGFALAAVTGCGGTLSGATYTVANVTSNCAVNATFRAIEFFVDVRGGTGSAFVIQNRGADPVQVTGDGRYTFTTGILEGAPFAVTVAQQPLTQVCAVAGGVGVVSGTQSNVVTVSCLDRVVTAPPTLTIRSSLDANGSVQQHLYVRQPYTDLHQLRIRQSDGGLEVVAPAWSVPTVVGPGYPLVTFALAPDGARFYHEEGLATVRTAAVRDSDGALVPSWSADLGLYSPLPPVLLGPVRPSPDGRHLYRTFVATIAGYRYRDVWIGTASDTGLSVLAGSPFMQAAGEDNALHFDSTGRYFASHKTIVQQTIEVFSAPTSAAPVAALAYSYPANFVPGSILASEQRPRTLLYEMKPASTVANVPVAPPEVIVHRWRSDGSLERLGAAHVLAPLSGEVTSPACQPPNAATQRISLLSFLATTSADARYVVEGQRADCAGIFGDRRALGLFIVRIAGAQSTLVPVAIDALPGFADLDASAWAHPGRPWIYFGSKYGQRVYGYSTDLVTGAVQALPGSPADGATVYASSQTTVTNIVGDPAGRFLYMTRFPDDTGPRYVDAFAIDQSTGALTAVDTYVLP